MRELKIDFYGEPWAVTEEFLTGIEYKDRLVSRYRYSLSNMNEAEKTFSFSSEKQYTETDLRGLLIAFEEGYQKGLLGSASATC